jgi:hypothetical protein
MYDLNGKLDLNNKMVDGNNTIILHAEIAKGIYTCVYVQRDKTIPFKIMVE